MVIIHIIIIIIKDQQWCMMNVECHKEEIKINVVEMRTLRWIYDVTDWMELGMKVYEEV